MNFDLDKLKEAVECPTIEIPNTINTFDEFIEWITNTTKENKE